MTHSEPVNVLALCWGELGGDMNGRGYERVAARVSHLGTTCPGVTPGQRVEGGLRHHGLTSPR